MDIESNRLTVADHRRIDLRVGETLEMWSAHGARVQAGDLLALHRIAHHAIGCTADDLRTIELYLIDQQVAALVAAGSATDKALRARHGVNA